MRGLARWICLGKPLTRNTEKAAETMVEVGMQSLWKNRQQQNTKSFGNAVKKLKRKKLLVTKKKISVVKPGRRNDTTILRYT